MTEDIVTKNEAPTLRARNAARMFAQAEAAATAKPFDAIPQIDISPLFADDLEGRCRVGEAIRQSCVEVGFFYISGHQVDDVVADQAFDAAQRFFGLPLPAKQAVSILNSPKLRGYTGLLEENTDPDNNGDLHEAFDASLDLDPDDPDAALGIYGWGENQWPDLAGFRDQVMAYHHAMLNLCEALYRGFALSLDLDEQFFAPMLTKPIAELRLLHYPPQGDQVDVIGIGAHSDYDVFTVLATDDVPALEIMNPSGDWISAPPIPGTFIVNVGDLLQRWTNDLYRSTVHRAANLSKRERFSIPFFSNVNPLEMIAVLPSCQSPTRPARYEPIGAAAYVEACMQEAYGV